MRLKGFVYVIGNDELGLFKIGFSRNHPSENRLKHLQVGSPVILRLAACTYVENAPREETRLHELFAEKHEHHEWYRLSPDDLKNMGETLIANKPIKLCHTPRTLSRQEAKVVLTLEQQGRKRTSRSEIIKFLEGTEKAADHVISALREKGWLERTSYGQYRLVSFNEGVKNGETAT
jgi:hypothetical protein